MTTRVCSVTDLEPAQALRAEVDGVAVAVVRDSDGSWHAIDDLCTHGNYSLSEGEVEDGQIECWRHGACFDLRTGAQTMPATRPVNVHHVSITDDDVFVTLSA